MEGGTDRIQRWCDGDKNTLQFLILCQIDVLFLC